MKGKRGNTMLFPWEVERLINLVKEENDGICLDTKHFTFDSNNYTIVQGHLTSYHDIGSEIKLNWESIKKSETYFQAFILQNLKVENNDFYPEIFGRNIIWIGNEVFAGSGMQKIDLMTIESINQAMLLFRIIELKHPKSKAGINSAPSQLEYYINWAREDIGGHLIGSKQFNIKPILIVLTKKFDIISKFVVDEIKDLKGISFDPEIWEINFNGKTRRIL